MAARYCALCDTPWPINEQYRTAFGTRAVRSANEICPACGTATQLRSDFEPLDTTEIAQRHAEMDAARQREAFDKWYANRAADELNTSLEGWLSHDAA